MDDENAGPEGSRIPTLGDLAALCRALNDEGARYMVVGGWAIIQHGYTRTTQDIDLLIEDSLENQRRVKKALEVLPDKAILELGDEDIRDYVVVRVADEVLVDLMTSACGIRFEEVGTEIVMITVAGISIPFATPELLLRMKQTHRERDAADRIFLHRKIAGKASAED